MTHKMGLLAGDIPAEQTAYDVITYDGNTYNAQATGEKWDKILDKCTSSNWNASTTFSSTDKPYNDGSTLYYISKPDETITISTNGGTQLYSWEVSDMTISDENEYQTFSIPVPDYSNAFNKKVWEFAYVSPGGIKTWSAPHTGTYTLECWGAGGGSGFTSDYTTSMYTPAGGYGGYSVGNITLNASTPCYIVVGGAGNNGQFGSYEVTPGGYNGGGAGAWNKKFTENNTSHTGTWYGRVGSGGGATHIGLKSGLLTTFSSDYSTKLLLVAGGGGGGGTAGGSIAGTGGHGGGYSGTNGGAGNGTGTGTAGTQTSGSAFGQGGARNNDTGYQAGGGGGGGFYGGVAGSYGGTIWGGGGGGGSGYINTNSGKLSNAAMYGYGVSTSTATATKTYSTSNVSSTPTAQYAKTGAGYARITYTKP